MKLLALLAALTIDHWRPATERRPAALLASLADSLQRHFNAGEIQHGAIAWIVGVVPIMLLAWVVYALADSLHPLLGLAVNIGALYLAMGFHQASQYFNALQRALRDGELSVARDILARWSPGPVYQLSGEEIVRVGIEQALVSAHRSVFGVMFWFLLLPGPAGAFLYRVATYLATRWADGAQAELRRFGWFANRAFAAIDWIPARLTGIAFAIVGDFEDAVYCWRTQAARWSDPSLGVVLASGAGALGVRLGDPLSREDGSFDERPELGLGEPPHAPYLDSTIGLIWRALVLWLVLVLIVTIVRVLS